MVATEATRVQVRISTSRRSAYHWEARIDSWVNNSRNSGLCNSQPSAERPVAMISSSARSGAAPSFEAMAREISQDVHPRTVLVDADTTGLLRDITGVLANEHVNVTGLQTHSNKSDGTASMQVTVEIGSLNALGRLLAKIEQQPNVIEARRYSA